MMQPRVLPCLLLKGEGLVKTVRFKEPCYLGDPRNVMRIFNEKEVDEIILLDIEATPRKRSPRFDIIEEIVSEAFMPVAYGGGIKELDHIKRLTNIGVEKVVLESYAIENPGFVREAVDIFGSQSIVVCMDVRRNLLGQYEVFTHGGERNARISPRELAMSMERMGAGEIMVNSVDRDGTMHGYDIGLVRSVASSVNIPVIACGGAGKLSDLYDAVKEGGASAAAAGSMFVFQGKHRAVLISYPAQSELKGLFASV